MSTRQSLNNSLEIATQQTETLFANKLPRLDNLLQSLNCSCKPEAWKFNYMTGCCSIDIDFASQLNQCQFPLWQSSKRGETCGAVRRSFFGGDYGRVCEAIETQLKLRVQSLRFNRLRTSKLWLNNQILTYFPIDLFAINTSTSSTNVHIMSSRNLIHFFFLRHERTMMVQRSGNIVQSIHNSDGCTQILIYMVFNEIYESNQHKS